MNNKVFIGITLFILFSFVLYKEALSWEPTVTHRDMSLYAAENSVLSEDKGDYLKKNLGFEKGLEDFLKLGNDNKKIKDWITEGANLEDSYSFWKDIVFGDARPENHFHNPLKAWSDAGLNDIKTGKSSLLWAQDGSYQQNYREGDWSWQTIRDKYYWALTDTTEAQRQMNFAQTFRGLGHQMHLIQDATVPEHVRNDAHISSRFEAWAKDAIPDLIALKAFAPNPQFPALSLDPSQYTLDSSYYTRNLVPSALFLDTDQYDKNNPSQFFTTNLATSLAIGIAEYTNANFASPHTIFTEDKPTTDKHYFPYPNKSSTNLQELIDKSSLDNVKYVEAKDGITEPSLYISKNKDGYGEKIEHFVKPKYTTRGKWDLIGGGYVYKLDFYHDKECHADYAEKLIPRAVGYSAGLLDYFFRGTLEITAPDAYVYSIIDGSVTPQQFTRITAKVRNSTPDSIPGEEIQNCDALLQNCIIQAVARYKKRTDYQPDLSTDPPTAASREPDFSYSVSESIVITSLSSTTPVEFTFDFTNSPIPVGITDLYLHVVFKGTLGNETDIAIAVGMKDLNEPDHHTAWNATDRFYLDGVLRTADEIRNDPDLLSRASGQFIDPYDITTEIAFYPSGVTPTVYNATFTPLPPGRYGRVIILTDMPTFYMLLHRKSINPPEDMTTTYLFAGVTNQEIDGIFYNTQVNTFRGIIQHRWSAYARYYPYATGISTAPWPVPAITDPYPATNIYP